MRTSITARLWDATRERLGPRTPSECVRAALGVEVVRGSHVTVTLTDEEFKLFTEYLAANGERGVNWAINMLILRGLNS